MSGPQLLPAAVVAGHIKPNNVSAPSAGNITGILIPKTTPNGATGGPITTLPSDPVKTPQTPQTPQEKSWWASWGGIAHDALDVAGAISVVGIVADGANVAIYTAEGNYVV